MTFSASDESAWSATFNAGQSALTKRDFAAAANEFQRAIELAERYHLTDEYLVESLEGLAAARFRAEKSSDVEFLFTRASEIRDRLLAETEASLGPDDLKVAECLDRCAFHRSRRGSNSEAIALYQRALEIRQSAHGELHFDVANTLTIMAGVCYRRQSDSEPRAELWQRAVRILEHLHDNPETDSLEVAFGLHGNLENLAVHQFKQGDFAAAEALFRRAIEVLNEFHGESESHQLCNVPTYAKVLIRQSKYREAEDVLSTSMHNRRLRAMCKDALIELYESTGRHDEAAALRDES